jgi:hypothetical protein
LPCTSHISTSLYVHVILGKPAVIQIVVSDYQNSLFTHNERVPVEYLLLIVYVTNYSLIQIVYVTDVGIPY